MKILKKLGFASLAGLALTLLVHAPVTLSASAPVPASPPVYIEYYKVPTGPNLWEGTTSGDVVGTISASVLDGAGNGFTGEYIVDAGEKSLTIQASMHFSQSPTNYRITGQGVVIAGWLAGAKVHVQAEVVDLNTGGISGVIRIMPDSGR